MRIELRHVSKRYGKQLALGDVSLDIPHGARVALVGPNGSGKSTLLRCVMGLLSCEGEVLLDGRAPFAHRNEIAARLAYVPQVAPQLGATVREVVRAVTTLRGLDPAHVAEVAGKLDLAVEPIASRPFRALSGGMKQKLLIALAFGADASLLILDEPTASLDERARTRFSALLDEAAGDATVLLCSHRAEEVQRMATRVVSLADGSIARDLSAVGGTGGAAEGRCAGGGR